MPDSSYILWDMDPVLFTLGPLSIRWYGLLFMTGFLVGFFIMRSVFRREGKSETDLDPLLLYMMLGTVIGARLGHVLFYDPVYYLTNPADIPAVWKGGLASHGGAIGILIALYYYARKRRDQPYLWIVDRIVIPTALAGFFIRLANLFNSEIIGVPTDKAWAFIFSRVDQQPRHPAQLYESLSYLAIFAVLMWVYRKLGDKTPKGLLLGLFLVLIFTARFLIEFVKERQAAFGETLPLSMGQLLSIPAVLIGAMLIYRATQQAKA